MKNIFISILIFCLASLGFSQSLEIETKLDTLNTVIGTPIKLSLKATSTVALKDHQKLHFPQINDTVGKGVEVFSKSKIIKSFADGKEIYLQEILISAYDSGIYVIPPMTFVFDNAGKKQEIQTRALRFGVQTVKIDPKKVAGIKLPYQTPITLKEIVNEYGLYTVLFILLVLLVLFVLYYLKKRQSGEKLFEKYVPKDPAHIIAIRALDNLTQEKLWQQGLIKQYHSEVTDIVRRYIEDRFGVLAMEQTTIEILKDLKDVDLITTDFYRKLQSMFELADLVKFAKYTPAIEDNDISLENAYEIVRATKYVEQLLEENDFEDSDVKQSVVETIKEEEA